MGDLTPRPKRLQGGWHAASGADGYTLARHWPPRFDLAARTSLPKPAPGTRLSPSRLARQVRQDVWRVLQGLRGFSPVVQIQDTGEGVFVIAGGRLIGRAPQGRIDDLQDVLDDPARRARWVCWASRRVT